MMRTARRADRRGHRAGRVLDPARRVAERPPRRARRRVRRGGDGRRGRRHQPDLPPRADRPRGSRSGSVRYSATCRRLPFAVLSSLFAGPNATERDALLDTAIPSDVELLDARPVGRVLTVDLNDVFDELTPDGPPARRRPDRVDRHRHRGRRVGAAPHRRRTSGVATRQRRAHRPAADQVRLSRPRRVEPSRRSRPSRRRSSDIHGPCDADRT